MGESGEKTGDAGEDGDSFRHISKPALIHIGDLGCGVVRSPILESINSPTTM
jgi:hypothetical protein